MKKAQIILLFAIIPITAFALDYKRQSLMYTDAPFLPSEAAGISVLTNLNAVQGYPDGAFYPKKTLNRAEFLKIAFASHPKIRSASSDSDQCFPDVNREDWFSQYVCLAKKRGVIGGYPDGTFKPENPINYAEALKIMGELYEYTAYADPDAQWWEVYMQAARNHKTILPVNLSLDSNLTRGQMARLAAAYRAEYEGELDYYRRAESGEDVEVAFSSSSFSSQSSSEVSSSQSSSSSQTKKEATIPTQNQLLLVGETHQIGDGVLYPRAEDVQMRVINVIFKKEVKSLSKLFVKDANGTDIAELLLDNKDNKNETWSAEIPIQSGAYVFSGSKGTPYVVEAETKAIGSGGFSGERIQIKSVFLVVGKVSNPAETYQVVPSSAHYPEHQTVLGKITEVKNALTGTGELLTGKNQRIAGFLFLGKNAVGNSAIRLEHIGARILASYSVVVNNVKISSGTLDKYACSMSTEDRYKVSCANLPVEMGTLTNESRILEFYADIDVNNAGEGAQLQLIMEDSGSFNIGGDVRFSDGSGHFIWIEQEGTPLAVGKMWVKE